MNFKVLRLRILEVFLVGFGTSIFGAIFSYFLDNDWLGELIMAIIADVALIIILGIQLGKFRLEVSGLDRYYKYNMTAVAIYCALGLALAVVIHFMDLSRDDTLDKVYEFIFFGFRSTRFFSVNDQTVIGRTTAAIFHSVFMLGFTALVPVIVNKGKIEFEKSKTRM